MNVEDIRKAESESYDKWFERWYAKQRLEEKLKQSAMQGYNSYSYSIGDNRTDYENRRMDDKRFVNKLKEKLNGFTVYRKGSERYDLDFLGKKFGSRWTDPEIIISWKEVERK